MLQIEFSQRKSQESSSAVLQAQNRFDTLLESVRGDQHKMGSLEESLAALQGERRAWEDSTGKLEAALSQQHEVGRRDAEEKQALKEERLTLQGGVASQEVQLGVQKAELEAGLGRERGVTKELERLIEVWTIVLCRACIIYK